MLDKLNVYIKACHSVQSTTNYIVILANVQYVPQLDKRQAGTRSAHVN